MIRIQIVLAMTAALYLCGCSDSKDAPAPEKKVPTAPASLSAQAIAYNQITLAWEDCSDNEEGFSIERSADGTEYVTVIILEKDITVYTDTSLTESTKYFYRINSFNSTGESDYADVLETATSAAPAPAAPTKLAATQIGSKQITIQWKDNSDCETGFYVSRSVGSTASSSFVQVSQEAANAQQYIDTDITPGTIYYYRVRAFNAAGTSSIAALTVTSKTVTSSQIIANHTIVSSYALIPQKYIDIVKTMLLNVPGESHGAGYREGCNILMSLEPKFAVLTSETEMLAASTSYLRVTDLYHNGSSWQVSGGEEDFWTTSVAVDIMKEYLDYMKTNSNPVAVFGFAWCYDMVYQDMGCSTELDPVYNVHWYGRSNRLNSTNAGWWGLDSGDSVINMDTYLAAVEAYNAYAPATKTFYSTGPMDGAENTLERGYQREIKHQYIRNYVLQDSSRILFDYADIMAYNDNNELSVKTWNGYTFSFIHADNLKNLNDENNTDPHIGHVGERGALRIGKALWWMLARIAGWDGVSTN